MLPRVPGGNVDFLMKIREAIRAVLPDTELLIRPTLKQGSIGAKISLPTGMTLTCDKAAASIVSDGGAPNLAQQLLTAISAALGLIVPKEERGVASGIAPDREVRLMGYSEFLRKQKKEGRVSNSAPSLQAETSQPSPPDKNVPENSALGEVDEGQQTGPLRPQSSPTLTGKIPFRSRPSRLVVRPTEPSPVRSDATKIETSAKDGLPKRPELLLLLPDNGHARKFGRAYEAFSGSLGQLTFKLGAMERLTVAAYRDSVADWLIADPDRRCAVLISPNEPDKAILAAAVQLLLGRPEVTAQVQIMKLTEEGHLAEVSLTESGGTSHGEDFGETQDEEDLSPTF
jgi:hypothetical protein